MRLSKRGWNNVIIFAALLIIFTVNFHQELSSSLSPPRETAIPTDLTVLEIKTPDYTITRVGRNWQSTPQIGLTSERLRQIVSNWQNILLDSRGSREESLASFSIQIFVTEQKAPIIATLHQQKDDSYIIQIDDQRFLRLPVDQLPLFIGR